MRKMSVTAWAFALFVGLSGSALAADTAAPKPIVVKDKVTVQATVEAIDHENRTVVLKGPKGNLVNLIVDDGVTRFDSMKVGDTVTATYYESVAYEIQKPGTAAAPDTITDAAGKLSGQKPGGGLVSTSVSTVTIVAIDLDTPAVTVRTSDGAKLSFRVRHRENLNGVKVGDQVKVTQTSALMIAVEGAK